MGCEELNVFEGLGVEREASFLNCHLHTYSCCGRAYPPIKMDVTEYDLKHKDIPPEYYEGEPGQRFMKVVETGCIAFRHPSKYPDNPGCRLSAENRPNSCLTCVVFCRKENRLFILLSCPESENVIKNLLLKNPAVENYVRNCARIFKLDDELRRLSCEQFDDLKYVLDIGTIEDWL